MQLAGQLAAQRRSLAAGHPEEIIAYVPPRRVSGPLPDDLRRRFEALRSEALAVEAEVTKRRDASAGGWPRCRVDVGRMPNPPLRALST